MKVILFVVGLVVVISMIYGGGDGDDPGDVSETVGDDIGAKVICEQFVERRLKSPSSADYSDESASHVGGKIWSVSGAVDSENSFGAMIRNEYLCEVKFLGGDRWQLQSLTGLAN